MYCIYLFCLLQRVRRPVATCRQLLPCVTARVLSDTNIPRRPSCWPVAARNAICPTTRWMAACLSRPPCRTPSMEPRWFIRWSGNCPVMPRLGWVPPRTWTLIRRHRRPVSPIVPSVWPPEEVQLVDYRVARMLLFISKVRRNVIPVGDYWFWVNLIDSEVDVCRRMAWNVLEVLKLTVNARVLGIKKPSWIIFSHEYIFTSVSLTARNFLRIILRANKFIAILLSCFFAQHDKTLLRRLGQWLDGV